MQTATKDQTAVRVEAGLQCPECYSVNVSVRQTRFESSPHGFQCEGCGCNWSRRITKASDR